MSGNVAEAFRPRPSPAHSGDLKVAATFLRRRGATSGAAPPAPIRPSPARRGSWGCLAPPDSGLLFRETTP